MAENTTAATKQVLDFTNVKERGSANPKHRPAGDYKMKVTKVEGGKSSKGNEQWVFFLVPTDMQSAIYPYYCQLAVEHMWKIRNLLIAAGLNVPKKKVAVDPNKLVGKEVGVTLDDDEYEGKLKSVITAVFPASDLEDDELPADDTEDELPDDDGTDPADEVTEDDMEELDVEDL